MKWGEWRCRRRWSLGLGFFLKQDSCGKLRHLVSHAIAHSSSNRHTFAQLSELANVEDGWESFGSIDDLFFAVDNLVVLNVHVHTKFNIADNLGLLKDVQDSGEMFIKKQTPTRGGPRSG